MHQATMKTEGLEDIFLVMTQKIYRECMWGKTDPVWVKILPSNRTDPVKGDTTVTTQKRACTWYTLPVVEQPVNRSRHAFSTTRHVEVESVL